MTAFTRIGKIFDMEERALTERIIGCAMKVHNTLGAGFLESVYQNALGHELSKSGLKFERGRNVDVYYDEVLVGRFVIDILVEGSVLLELKAVQCLVAAHEMQLVNYLTATRIDVGLLLNFGGTKLEFKRKSRTYIKKTPAEDIVL